MVKLCFFQGLATHSPFPISSNTQLITPSDQNKVHSYRGESCPSIQLIGSTRSTWEVQASIPVLYTHQKVIFPDTCGFVLMTMHDPPDMDMFKEHICQRTLMFKHCKGIYIYIYWDFVISIHLYHSIHNMCALQQLR